MKFDQKAEINPETGNYRIEAYRKPDPSGEPVALKKAVGSELTTDPFPQLKITPADPALNDLRPPVQGSFGIGGVGRGGSLGASHQLYGVSPALPSYQGKVAPVAPTYPVHMDCNMLRELRIQQRNAEIVANIGQYYHLADGDRLMLRGFAQYLENKGYDSFTICSAVELATQKIDRVRTGQEAPRIPQNALVMAIAADIDCNNLAVSYRVPR